MAYTIAIWTISQASSQLSANPLVALQYKEILTNIHKIWKSSCSMLRIGEQHIISQKHGYKNSSMRMEGKF
jgi:hypothetical protein